MSYPELSRLDTRSRSRDLSAAGPLPRESDSSDWRETMGYLMNALANDEGPRDSVDSQQRLLTRSAPLEGKLSEMSLDETKDGDVSTAAGLVVVAANPEQAAAGPGTAPANGVGAAGNARGAANGVAGASTSTSPETPEASSSMPPPPPAVASSDYLLALTSSSSGGERGEKRAPSFEDSRARGDSNEIYAEMLQLLETDGEEPRNVVRGGPRPAALADATATHAAKKQARKPREKKPKAKPEAKKLAPRPIAPKPRPAATRGGLPLGALAAADDDAKTDRLALARRAAALRSRGRISQPQCDEAKLVATSADSFILHHLADALSELETFAESASDQTKLALLLEIYASVHAYMEEPPPVMPPQISAAAAAREASPGLPPTSAASRRQQQQQQQEQRGGGLPPHGGGGGGAVPPNPGVGSVASLQPRGSSSVVRVAGGHQSGGGGQGGVLRQHGVKKLSVSSTNGVQRGPPRGVPQTAPPPPQVRATNRPVREVRFDHPPIQGDDDLASFVLDDFEVLAAEVANGSADVDVAEPVPPGLI